MYKEINENTKFIIYNDASKINKTLIPSNILDFVDNLIEENIHDIGFDAFILKVNRFSSSNYHNLVDEYERIYNSGAIYTNKNIDDAFFYTKSFLEANLAYITVNEYYISYGLNALEVFKEMFRLSENKNYKYLSDFYEYCNSMELKKGM